jgi:uncharacterized protein (DUF885 family)
MNARLERLIDETLAYQWETSPTAATAAGEHRHDHRLADCDPDRLAEIPRRLSELRNTLRRIESEEGDLTDDERLDIAVLDRSLETDIRLHEEVRASFRDPAHYLEEILYGVYFLVQREFAPLEERAAAATGRLTEVPRLLEQAKRNLADPAGIPPAWVETALQLARGSRTFLEDLDRDLAPRTGAAEAGLRAALRAARGTIEEFGRHVRERIAPAAAGRFAVGRSLYEFLLDRQHGVGFDAASLRAFGEELVRDAQRRLSEATRAIDPDRSWQELVQEWKKDHPSRAGFLDAYRGEVARARAFVAERGLATLPPEESLQVVETPPFQRAICPFAAYLPPGPFEPRKTGYLWVTPPDPSAPPEAQERLLQDHLRPAMPATMVHEAYPGHHLQLSAASRLPSRVRRHFATAVFVEGWAFYCEAMMGEEGFYRDPRSGVLQIKDQLWRACRVVIDVGIQTEELSLEQAAAMLHDVARIELPNARGEVLRYARSPSQPMSYAVGKHEILRLREDDRRRRGAGFSLRSFHDRLLEFGSIPLSLIRERLLPRV